MRRILATKESLTAVNGSKIMEELDETPVAKKCSRCVYDESVPNIVFDEAGVCNYCQLYDSLNRQYPNTGTEGEKRLQELVDEIRVGGKGKKYDCVVGVSGGCDSSFLLHTLVGKGVRPLAVHFDNTWNSPIATQNIYKIVNKLGVELFTYVVDNREYDDIYRAFLLAGVPDIDAPTDIGFISTLYLAAERYGLKYIAEGHSFRTEGISPLGWLYMDGKYIKSIHQEFGKKPMVSFPNMTLWRFLRWSAIRGIKRVRPLYYVDYDKEKTKKMLAESYDWQWYGGHHLENRFTAFYQSYFMPRRFGVDQRANGFSALIRSGQMDREDALTKLMQPPWLDEQILSLVKKRLNFSDVEFEKVMTQEHRTWQEFPTYKKTFEKLRLLFFILTKMGRIPESFYVKFCFKKGMGDTTLQTQRK